MPKIFESFGTMSLLMGATPLVLGAVLLGASASVLSNMDFLSGYSNAMSAGGGDEFASAMQAYLIVIAGACMIVVTGVLGLVAHFGKIRTLLLASIALSCVGSLVIIAGGGLAMRNLSLYTNDVLVPNLIPDCESVSRNDLSRFPDNGDIFTDFGNAVFDECCDQVRVQSQFPICADAGACEAPICDPLEDERLDRVFVDGIENILDPKLLCSCISDESRYDDFRKAISDGDFCEVLKSSRINNPTSLVIPESNDRLSVEFAIDQQPDYRNTDVRNIKSIPIVGPIEGDFIYPEATGNSDDLDNFDVNNDRGFFGCGLGYYKGIYWFITLFIERNYYVPAYVALAVGGGTLILLLIFTYVAYLEVAEDSYGDSSYEKQQSNLGYNNNNQPQQQYQQQQQAPKAVVPMNEPDF